MDWAAGTVTESKIENRAEDHTVQGSQAWLRWRGKGLGSSDAAVLLGWSPWKTLQQLLDEKCGRWKQDFGPQQQAAMDRGKRLEPEIRTWYELNYGGKFPDGAAEHPEFKFMRASFDGINREIRNGHDGSTGRLIEIKAPNAKDHELAAQGFVPDKYQPQTQWLMMVANIPFLHYVSYGTDGNYYVVPVYRDVAMQAELQRRAVLFWELVEAKATIAPDFPKYVRPMHSLDLSAADEEDQLNEKLISEVLLAQEESKKAAAKYEAMKERVKKCLDKAGKSEMRCYDAEFGYTERKGAVDYGKVPQLQGVDLEPFRKAAVKVFYFDRVKK